MVGGKKTGEKRRKNPIRKKRLTSIIRGKILKKLGKNFGLASKKMRKKGGSKKRKQDFVLSTRTEDYWVERGAAGEEERDVPM